MTIRTRKTANINKLGNSHTVKPYLTKLPPANLLSHPIAVMNIRVILTSFFFILTHIIIIIIIIVIFSKNTT